MKLTCEVLDMNGPSQAMYPSEPFSEEIPNAVWFIMNDTETEVFIRDDDMVYKFMSNVQKFPTFMVVDILDELDGNVQKVIELIQDLIKSLDEIENNEKKSFWRSQIIKLREDVFSHKRIHVRSCGKDPEKDREYLERASQEALVLKRITGLDWKGFAKVKGHPNESEVSEAGAEGNDDENLDRHRVDETEDTSVMVEDQDKLDRKLDKNSLVVEKVNDNVEVSISNLTINLKKW